MISRRILHRNTIWRSWVGGENQITGLFCIPKPSWFLDKIKIRASLRRLIFQESRYKIGVKRCRFLIVLPIGHLFLSGIESEVARLLVIGNACVDMDGEYWIMLHHPRIS